MRRIAAETMAALLILILLSNALAPVAAAQRRQEVIGECTLRIAAVSSAGGGVLGNLTVKVTEGTGRVYISTSPATEVDTQGAALIAAFTASMLLGLNPARYDFYYTLESPSIIVGGPSAGAAMAVATMAALTGAECNTRDVITGMVYPDGTIGPVGGLREKLQAVAEGGGRLFIVPRGQLVYTSYERVVERIGPLALVKTVPVEVNLSSEGARLGVEVREAGTIAEAARLLLGIEVKLPEDRGAPESPRGLDEVYTRLLDYYAGLNSTMPEGREFEAYRDSAGALYEQAQRMAEEGRYFIASRLLIDALSTAQAAVWLEEALANGLNVTSQLEQALASLDNATMTLQGGGTEAAGLGYLYAWLAADQIRRAQELLDNGSLPVGISLTGRVVDTRPLEMLASGFWLSRFATMLAGLDWPSVDPGIGQRFLAVSLARSMTAYAATLAGEAGVDLGDAARVALDMAVSAGGENSTLGSVYLGLASAALASSLIHGAFDRGVLLADAESIAYGMAASTGSQAALAMLEAYEYYKASGDYRRAWTYLDLAILFSWTLSYNESVKPGAIAVGVQATGSGNISGGTGNATTPGATGTGSEAPSPTVTAILVGLVAGFGAGAIIGLYLAMRQGGGRSTF